MVIEGYTNTIELNWRLDPLFVSSRNVGVAYIVAVL